MKKQNWGLIISTALLLVPLATGAQEPVYWDVVDRIRTEGFENSEVMENAGYLADVIGPRFTGSPNMREAQDWAVARMTEFALSRIEREPWGDQTVGWEVQRVSVHMTAPDYQMVIAYPLALTPGTPGPVIANAVIATIRTPGDLDRYRGLLDGAIVLAPPPMPLTPPFRPAASRHGAPTTRQSAGARCHDAPPERVPAARLRKQRRVRHRPIHRRGPRDHQRRSARSGD